MLKLGKPDIPAVQNRILFVDDEVNILRALQRLFMDENVEIFTANSGPEGLKILSENRGIGVIVSDQRMPEMTGVDFLEKSKKISPNSIRILLTGYADVNAAIDAINRGGASRYLNKPWKDDELLQHIRSALQMYSLFIENTRLNGIIKEQNEKLQYWNQELEAIVQEQTMELQKSYDQLRATNSKIRSNFKSTIAAFSALIELRNKGMRSHARNVAEIAMNTGKTLNLPQEELETIMIAALLHDIGKIGISDLMLQREAEMMNYEEREEYLMHPVRGQAAIDAIEELQPAGILIRSHHENYDGSGFPDGIRKKEIPLGAKIIAIADYIDKKIRKMQWTTSFDVTKKEVLLLSGTLFDPKLVPVVLEQAGAFYKKHRPKTDRIEIELLPNDLAEGMEVTRDVFSGTGIMLLSKGTVLNKSSIMLLKRYHELDPGKHGVFINIKD